MLRNDKGSHQGTSPAEQGSNLTANGLAAESWLKT